MTGAAKTLDKIEEKARKNPLADPGARIAGTVKQKYGESHDIDTSGVGYAGAKQAHEADIQTKQIESDQAAAKAAQDATAAAALEKSQQSQVDALKRKGRRASIMTSTQGVGSPLGVPGTPGA